MNANNPEVNQTPAGMRSVSFFVIFFKSSSSPFQDMVNCIELRSGRRVYILSTLVEMLNVRISDELK